MSHVHRTIAKYRLPESEFEIKQVEKETPSSQGPNYHDYGNDWWTNGRSPDSFKFLSLDSLYPSAYFDSDGSTGHPTSQMAKDVYEYMQKVYGQLFGRAFHSILELGTGGGEITKAFQDHELDYLAIEGTSAGYEKLRSGGHPSNKVAKYDLRFMPYLGRRFELCMSTEVFEHIEPPFASKLVENCTLHADVIWCSGADRNRRPHYHHINELPIEAWDNLFAMMGCTYHVPLNRLYDRGSRLYIADYVGRRLASAAEKIEP